MSNGKIVYVCSKKALSIFDLHPKTLQRASMVHSLISAYNLLDYMTIVEPLQTTSADLLLFHSHEYVDTLKTFGQKLAEDDDTEFTEDDLEILSEHGLEFDCSPFPLMHTYCKKVVGATLAAVDEILNDTCRVAINLNGGWHHAQADQASGFCYVNDIVIGILKMQAYFNKILYIDLDCHHGDIVEQAFAYTDKVYTLSLHKYAKGYFPGSGARNEQGNCRGKYHSLNVPLKEGMQNETFVRIFTQVFYELMLRFPAEAIVLQCGADCLSKDPLGGFNLTSEALIACVSRTLQCNLPTLILGGGGYHLANTARCWTQLVATVTGQFLNDDIPEHAYFDQYGPDYALSFTPSNRKNENSSEYIDTLMSYLINDNIRQLQLLDDNTTDHNKNNKSLPYCKKLDHK